MLRALTLLALGGILPLLAPATPADAQERRIYRFCHQIYEARIQQRFCGFTSYEQCMATASGIGGMCEENTEWLAMAQQQQQQHQPKRKPAR